MVATSAVNQGTNVANRRGNQRGEPSREAFLADMYATEVSADFISTVTDAVTTEVAAWQAPPLEPAYPVIFFDALRVKMRGEGTVRNKAVSLRWMC
jgi:transposase-like protein